MIGQPQRFSREEALRLRDEGLTQRAIADRLGVRHQAISDFLRSQRGSARNGPPPRPMEERKHEPVLHTYQSIEALAAKVGWREAQRQMHRRRA